MKPSPGRSGSECQRLFKQKQYTGIQIDINVQNLLTRLLKCNKNVKKLKNT